MTFIILFLLKDVIKRNNIRDTALLANIIKYLMDNIGNTFSAKTISDFLKNQGRKLSTETVYNYLHALENAFLINKVADMISRENVCWKLRKSITSRIWASVMLSSAIMMTILADFWKTLFIWSCCEMGILSGLESRVLQKSILSQTRCDERIYLQICYILTQENTDREFRPLETISDNYEKIVLSTDTLLHINRAGIRQKNIIDYLRS